MKNNNFSFTLVVVLTFFFISTKADEKFNIGKNLFLNNCAVCHTLSDAKSFGNIGPNLNQLKPNKMKIMGVVKNGIGVMPAYEGVLSSKDIEALSHYVSIASNN